MSRAVHSYRLEKRIQLKPKVTESTTDPDLLGIFRSRYLIQG